MTQILDLFASCPKGLEELLAAELTSFGAEPTKQHVAGISFRSDLLVAYRCCLWSRLANRILLPLGHFKVDSAQALYEGVAAIAWRDHFSVEHSFAVDFNGTNDTINNSQFGAQKVKDAVVDHFVWRCG
ncbi:MAG TPA: THUMP domain-containing protein, partial [Spongiibacteraceae bacterium]|nr:THUMP domain-containing protein [Spongiibacteraceae bacterium]